MLYIHFEPVWDSSRCFSRYRNVLTNSVSGQDLCLLIKQIIESGLPRWKKLCIVARAVIPIHSVGYAGYGFQRLGDSNVSS